MPGEMDLADKGWLQRLQVRQRVELEIVGGDVDVVHIAEQVASSPARQLGQERRLWDWRIAEPEIEGRVLDQDAPSERHLNLVHIAAHDGETFLRVGQRKEMVHIDAPGG